MIAGIFLLPALSLAGMPPFSGFIAKFSVFDAAAGERQWAVLAAGLVVAVLTLYSVFKIWVVACWGDPPTDRERHRSPRLMLVPAALLSLATLGIGVAAGPLYRLSERAASDLVDPSDYIEAVLRP